MYVFHFLGTFSAIIFSNLFSWTNFFLLSSWNSSDKNFRSCILFYWSLRLFNLCFYIFSFCFSAWVRFLDLCASSKPFSFIAFMIQWCFVFYFVIIIFIFEISTEFSLEFLFPIESFYLMIYLIIGHCCFIGHIYNDCFKVCLIISKCGPPQN